MTKRFHSLSVAASLLLVAGGNAVSAFVVTPTTSTTAAATTTTTTYRTNHSPHVSRQHGRPLSALSAKPSLGPLATLGLTVPQLLHGNNSGTFWENIQRVGETSLGAMVLIAAVQGALVSRTPNDYSLNVLLLAFCQNVSVAYHFLTFACLAHIF